VGRAGLATFAAAGATVAIALRAWVAASPLGGLDADEAVWGLMTLRALEGSFDVFFWGQSYGGTQEVLLGVPVFAAAGSGTASVRVVPLALFALGAVLVWRLGRRLLGEPGATAAAVFYAIWPAYLVWKSTRGHGFYGAAMVCSLLVLLLALRLSEQPRRTDAVLFGLALGVGWWATPQVGFVALPALIWLGLTLRGASTTLWPAVPAALVGAAPWITWNVLHPLASFAQPFERGDDTYIDHIRTFAFATFPSILGVRVPFTLDWLPNELVGRVVEGGVLLLLVVLLLSGRRRALLGAVALGYAVVQSVSPFSFLNEEPRYLVLLVPVLALALADVAARSLAAATVTAVVLAGLTAAGLHGMMSVEPPVPPVAGARVPADIRPALRTLERLDQRYVRARYEVAYRITFESRERIIASSMTAVRYRPYQDTVARVSFPAHVFVRGSPAELRWARTFPGYRRIVAGGWSVYVYEPRAP
jgi:hypothetical protein